MTETWDLWYPEAGSRGLSFARGALDHADVLLVHAATPSLRVEVVDQDGGRLAFGDGLQQTADTPIARLTRSGETITRQDIWPTEADLGLPIILPGGEVGILRSWWNAEDHSSWRWQVEFYNHR